MKRHSTLSVHVITYAALAILVTILAFTGTSDYDEQVILHMSQSTYDEISADLTQQNGSTPSEHEIVQEYKLRNND